jgi:hypothetical protein
MKAQPPFLTDDEADLAWHRSNEATFGHQLDEEDIKQQMDILQKILDQRKQDDLANRQPNPNLLSSRVFRQGIKTITSDKTTKNRSDQSKSPKQTFLKTGAVQRGKNQGILKNNHLVDQSSSSSETSFSAQRMPTVNQERLTGQTAGILCAPESTKSSGNALSPSDHQRLETRDQKSVAPSERMDLTALTTLFNPFGDLPEEDMTPEDIALWDKLANATDKFEAASIIQPAADKEEVNSTECRPSKIGRQRGKPKDTHNEEGNRNAVRKRKPVNDFGQDTFWNRPGSAKRKADSDPKVLAAIETSFAPHDLIVDTGASHVLFQQKHMGLLTHVQLTQPGKNPFAVLRAANGQILTAIGKGIFRVKHIAVLAYVFRDEDLVHNLLGIAPFADCGCKAVFTADAFSLYHRKTLILAGKRHSANLWHISLDREPTSMKTAQLHRSANPPAQPVLLLNADTRQNSKYVQFVHACMGSPPPTTFLHAVQKGYLAGEHQFPRLTAKMVRQYMPNSEATARGHLNKTPTAQPHSDSQSVSALRRAHRRSQRILKTKSEGQPPTPSVLFDPTKVPKSTTIHMDYTGRLPSRGSAGTLCFLVACWGSYIHLEPLASMKGTDTAAAITKALLFFLERQVHLDTIRMDNQSSPEVRLVAEKFHLKWELVNPYQKEPNRAERAIRTAKNHIIAVRSGFHRDCSQSLIDRCLFQVELTLNLMHPFEYDPDVSAHHGLLGERFNFARHPIAPLGAKVLTWDSPDTRGSWADHGVNGIYLGPAMRHFRGFHIWVPQTAAARVSGTVWWFLKPFVPDEDLLSPDNSRVLYPPTKDRLAPSVDGSDLLGRCFLDPSLGVCCITRLGPILTPDDDTLAVTLHYRCLSTQGEHIATVDQIAQWIRDGPLLSPPSEEVGRDPSAPVSYPMYAPYNISEDTSPEIPAVQRAPTAPMHDPTIPPILPLNEDETALPRVSPATNPLRRSNRKRKAPDFLIPKLKGKVYFASTATSTRKQRVPAVWTYLGKQRVTQPEVKIQRLSRMNDKSDSSSEYKKLFWRYRDYLRTRRVQRMKWLDRWSIRGDAMATSSHTAADFYERAMPRSTLPPVFPDGPLNLNPDGTTITYTKSHKGPHAAQWAQADDEEMERLFKSGTLRPIMFCNIPSDKNATYVNPVCNEKVKDDGAMKFRTRATIGGDRIDYPYTTTAITAELESIKLLLNAMISDNAAFSTVDLEDFYLGTTLPHPEYIRIPAKFISKKVMEFYLLEKFLYKGALFCIVLKTHYGLPQAGALSQARLFAHLEQHGYHQLFHAPALFRNSDGSIRFALVVDDFAVVWSSKKAMKHFLQTLRKMYTIKVDYHGSRYLGLDIAINRQQRHVTLSMPGYILKLLKKIRPNGIKGARTPSSYCQPNYKHATAQTATVDSTPLASPAQQKELQVVVGTLLYYARTVDPSILTVVHELGSVQASPSVQDMLKMERLLQYVSVHQLHGLRFHASNMQLQIQSDASYLSRTKARSVLGGFHYLGSTEYINGPFFCTSKIISCIVTSAAEAELGAAFQNAQKGAQFRNTLIELGYPQQASTILVDNTVAEGLAKDTVNARRSKSMDVRFFWLRDRVKKGEFLIKHLQGRYNISDFFTKPLPTDKFYQFLLFLIVVIDANFTTPKRQTVVMSKML